MKTDPRVPETMTVNEAIRRYPATVRVFNDFGVDACCGGAATVADAAVRDGADAADLLRALEAAAGEGAR